MRFERDDIPADRVVGLKETIGDTPEGLDDFVTIEDLVSSAIFSNDPRRKEYTQIALNRFLGTSVQIHTMVTEDEVFAYITLNGIEDGFFYVGTYPNVEHRLETVPSQRELDAFRKFCGDDFPEEGTTSNS